MSSLDGTFWTKYSYVGEVKVFCPISLSFEFHERPGNNSTVKKGGRHASYSYLDSYRMSFVHSLILQQPWTSTIQADPAAEHQGQ